MSPLLEVTLLPSVLPAPAGDRRPRNPCLVSRPARSLKGEPHHAEEVPSCLRRSMTVVVAWGGNGILEGGIAHHVPPSIAARRGRGPRGLRRLCRPPLVCLPVAGRSAAILNREEARHAGRG